MWRTPDNCVLIVWDDAPDDNDPTELLGWDILWIDKPREADRFHEAHNTARKLWGPRPEKQSRRAFCFKQDGEMQVVGRDYSPVEWMEKYK